MRRNSNNSNPMDNGIIILYTSRVDLVRVWPLTAVESAEICAAFPQLFSTGAVSAPSADRPNDVAIQLPLCSLERIFSHSHLQCFIVLVSSFASLTLSGFRLFAQHANLQNRAHSHLFWGVALKGS